MTTESGSWRRSHDPSNILRGAPVRVASSSPRQMVTANLPLGVRATGLPLKSFTAHCTPSTPRTRARSVSLSALVCSKYSVFESITQMSASVTSAIWLPVRLRIPAKIEVWFSSRNVQKAMVKMRPRYLARSPVNILSAMKFILALLYFEHTDWSVWLQLIKKESLRFQAVQIIEKSLARLQQQLLVLGVFGRTGHARLRRHDERRHFPRRNVSSHFACLDPAGERGLHGFSPSEIDLL